MMDCKIIIPFEEKNLTWNMKIKYLFKKIGKVNACYDVHKKMSQWQFSTCHGGYFKKQLWWKF
jgi:hypothetical protein